MYLAFALSLGHNLAEEVSVQAFLCSESTHFTLIGGALLEYVHDDAQVKKTNLFILYKVVYLFYM